VKPKRGKQKKNKGEKDKTGKTKDNSEKDGGGKETVATPVAAAQGGEMDLDDRWADQAFVPAASSDCTVPLAKRRATATEGAPAVIPGVTARQCGLGHEGTFLQVGTCAEVVNNYDLTNPLDFTAVILKSFKDGFWKGMIMSGPAAGQQVEVLPNNLRGQSC